VNWAAISAIGSVLSGAAILIAFIQLDNQRRERLRAQINQIGVWAQADTTGTREQPGWRITLFIKNASELPVDVHNAALAIEISAALAIEALGFREVHASAEGELYDDKGTGPTKHYLFFPRTIPPGHKWHGEIAYTPGGDFADLLRPRINIEELQITDAAGREWDMRPSQGGPARRVHSGREWPWRRGRLPSPGASKK
jgi:hypothetical protein